MINYQLLLILCIQMSIISTAPLQLQYQSQLSLQPTQEELLQQQLFALQQLQNMQMMSEWNNYYAPSLPTITQNQARPVMVFLPQHQDQNWDQLNEELNNQNLITKDGMTGDKETDKGDLDSVIIEAEPQSEPKPEPTPKKAILLIPNTRTLSIGGIISAIPFLPIEVNVPDTISWIYDGISSIISGIGNRFPIKRPTPPPQSSGDQNSLNLLVKRLQTRSPNLRAPILMLPDVAQMYPVQLPMQFN